MVNFDEENKIVHANQINYETFSKTSRFKKGADIGRDYELVVFGNYAPYAGDNKITNEESGDFYNRKEFKNTRGRS